MLLPLIAVACYVIGACWLATATYQHRSDPFSVHGRGGRIAAVAIASVGVLIHAIALMQERHIAPGARIGAQSQREVVDRWRQPPPGFIFHCISASG